MRTSRAGFTMIELMLVVAIIAVVAAMAIPQLRAAKITANEASAAATLRSLATAQGQVVASPSIDSDADGMGEYGYFAELAGALPVRVAGAGGPAAGAPGTDELVPASLASSFAVVNASVITKSGYVFQVWLPGPTAGGLVPGIPEDPNGGKLVGPFPEPDNGAELWCAYAWPLSRGQTGMPVFFVSNQGQILAYNNRGGVQYSGVAGGPAFDASYSVAGDMSSNFPTGGLPGADGNVWTILR